MYSYRFLLHVCLDNIGKSNRTRSIHSGFRFSSNIGFTMAFISILMAKWFVIWFICVSVTVDFNNESLFNKCIMYKCIWNQHELTCAVLNSTMLEKVERIVAGCCLECWLISVRTMLVYRFRACAWREDSHGSSLCGFHHNCSGRNIETFIGWMFTVTHLTQRKRYPQLE